MSCEWDFHPNDYHRDYWLHETNYTQQEMIDEFLNDYKSLMRHQCRLNSITGYAAVILGSLGLLGCTAALITLSQSIFSQVSFIYFKALNLIEIFYMMFLIEFGIQHFYESDLTYLRYYAWALIVAYGHGRGLINVLPAWVNCIVLAAAVERAVACHLPQQFKKINKKMVCISLIVGSFAICLAIYLPHIFFVKLIYVSNATVFVPGSDRTKSIDLYDPIPTEWAQSWVARCYVLVVDSLVILGAILHCATALAVILGFVKIIRRRDSSPQSDQKRSMYLDLCWLQMCETLPLAIYHVLRVTANQMPINKEHFRLPHSAYQIPEAAANLDTVELHLIFHTLAVIVGAIAHAMGFYFYVAFCPSVRRTFFDLAKKICICDCKFADRHQQYRESDSTGTELQTLRAKM